MVTKVYSEMIAITLLDFLMVDVNLLKQKLSENTSRMSILCTSQWFKNAKYKYLLGEKTQQHQ